MKMTHNIKNPSTSYKIISWNVNGIRASIKKGLLGYINEEDADFFHIQEIKIAEDDLIDLLTKIKKELKNDYFISYNCATKRRGYSGVLTLSKAAPVSVDLGLPNHASNNEGRLITLGYENFYMLNSYFPNTGRELNRLDFKMDYNNAFLDHIENLDKPSLSFGDFNVAHTEQDIARPKQNEKNAGFTKTERDYFTKLLESGYTDTFRHKNPDAIKYSWWAQMFKARERNVGWRIDYGVISNKLKDNIKRAEIYTEVMGSDHCPISLEIAL